MASVFSKEDALLELDRQLEFGRRLLERPIASYADLVAVNAERAAWSLANKKLLLDLIGDASALTRCVLTSELPDDIGNPLLTEVNRFRQVTHSQLTVLERMSLVMKRMA